MHKRNFVESKLTEKDREKFQGSSAKMQKQIMENFARGKKEEDVIERALPPTTRRYIDIEDESNESNGFQGERSHLNRQQAMALEEEAFQLRKSLTQLRKSNQTLAQNHYPGIEYGIPMELSAVFDRLTSEGITAETSSEILEQLQKEVPAAKMRSKSAVQSWLQHWIEKNTMSATHQVSHKFHFFFGDAGHGKTTALIKLASYFLGSQKKKILLASASDFRLGGELQLRYYSQILDVQFYNLRTAADWRQLADRQNEFDHILVGFAAPEVDSESEVGHFNHILQACPISACHHFVCSANLRGELLQKVFDRLRRFRMDDLIFSHFSDHLGGAFQFMLKNHLPVFLTHRSVRNLAEFEWGSQKIFNGVIK